MLITKCKLSSENYNFGNLVVTSVSLRASRYFALGYEIGGVINEHDFWYDEMCKHWEDPHTSMNR